MTISQRHKILAFLTVAGVAVVTLAAGLPGLELQPGRPLPIGALLATLRQIQSPYSASWELPLDPFRLIAALLWLALIITVVLFIFSPAARREILKRTIIYLIWGLIIYGMLHVITPVFSLPEQLGSATEAGDSLFDTATDEALPTPPRLYF